MSGDLILFFLLENEKKGPLVKHVRPDRSSSPSELPHSEKCFICINLNIRRGGKGCSFLIRRRRWALKERRQEEGVSWEFAASLTTQKYPSFCAQKEKKRRSYSSAQMPATPASLQGVEFA